MRDAKETKGKWFTITGPKGCGVFHGEYHGEYIFRWIGSADMDCPNGTLTDAHGYYVNGKMLINLMVTEVSDEEKFELQLIHGANWQ